MEPAYGFHSLFRFKLKFHPDEAKVYICYPDPAKLPQISLAVAQAYVPSRTLEECLSEELGRLYPDEIYAEVVTQGWDLINPKR